MFAILPSSDGCATATHLTLVGTLKIIVFQPVVKIALQHGDVGVDLFAECDRVKLLQDGFMKPFTDTVGLRRSRTSFSVLDVIECQIQFIIVMLGFAAIFRATVGQDSQHRHVVFLEKRQDAVVQEVSGGNGGLGGIALGKGDFAVSVDKGLLINPPHTLECPDVKRVLGTQIAGMRRLNFTTDLVIEWFFLQGRDLGLGQDNALVGHLGFQCP